MRSAESGRCLLRWERRRALRDRWVALLQDRFRTSVLHHAAPFIKRQAWQRVTSPGTARLYASPLVPSWPGWRKSGNAPER